ncbi:hypothetical protein O9G_003129 [Rozella allomycis CSF55]|uniref:Uncharacterized protein n=1 Tax=Rozella allomycis (strain CSF55) TaxID=988480 RepID=A0A075ANH8_ROZAC|nr:hypothetical protein O9G_003129 [Rozella allomycis CSF55]|eukprot:EPZ31407.1 hypothetical protein O9G_003129 [Rozella allomycis CSF55]
MSEDLEISDFYGGNESRDEEALIFMQKMVSTEVVSKLGAKVNHAFDLNHPKYPKASNRVELKTTFDFDKVKKILISDPVDYPGKKGYKYVHVLLFTDKSIFLIMPYIYDNALKTDKGINVINNLNDWLFINGLGQRSRHRIEQFD